LSVITRNQSGARQISVFRLVRGNSAFHTVEVVSNQLQQGSRQVTPSVDLASLQRGREAALRSNLLRSGDKLDLKILNFLNLLRNGTPTDTAMTRSGVSIQLVNKLTDLGRTSTPNVQPQRPLLPEPKTEQNITPANTPSSLDIDSLAEY
jgi:hypothetical protein